jgi:hypothetical protein
MGGLARAIEIRLVRFALFVTVDFMSGWKLQSRPNPRKDEARSLKTGRLCWVNRWRPLWTRRSDRRWFGARRMPRTEVP